MEFGFLAFGLAFFLYIINLIERGADKAYERRLMEAREFGSPKVSDTEPEKRRRK